MEKKNIKNIQTIQDNHEFFLVDAGCANGNFINKSTFEATLKMSLSESIGQKGEPGPIGEKGFKGNRGKIGDMGDIGEKGTIGNVGLLGVRGETGEKGEKGRIGGVGEVGQQGRKGYKGTIGDTGIKGSVGIIGEVGEPGYKGFRGNKGIFGEIGERGESGMIPPENAERGDTGDVGNNATFGPRGNRGQTGDNGSVGEVGMRGERGVPATKQGIIDHNLFGSNVIRNYTDLNVSSLDSVNLSLFLENDKPKFKFFRILLEIPTHDNLFSNDKLHVINLCIPGSITKFRPIVVGTSPIVWLRSNNTIISNSVMDRHLIGTPRNIMMKHNSENKSIKFFVTTTNSGIQNVDSKIYFKIAKIFGTNDI